VDGAGDTPGWIAAPVFSLSKTSGMFVCAVAIDAESARHVAINVVLFIMEI
jgi:hypothetical protein